MQSIWELLLLLLLLSGLRLQNHFWELWASQSLTAFGKRVPGSGSFGAPRGWNSGLGRQRPEFKSTWLLDPVLLLFTCGASDKCLYSPESPSEHLSQR